MDLSLNFLRALTLVVGPMETFVVVTSINLGYFGIQRRGSLVIRKPLGKRRLPTRLDTRQRLMSLRQRPWHHGFGGLIPGHNSSLVPPGS
jgi:hypothetical protein